MPKIHFQDYLENFQHPNKDIILPIHDFILSDKSMSCVIRFNTLFYDHKKWLCYFNYGKKREVELNFLYAKHMSEKCKKLLDFKNRKLVGSIAFTEPNEIDFDLIDLLLKESIKVEDKALLS